MINLNTLQPGTALQVIGDEPLENTIKSMAVGKTIGITDKHGRLQVCQVTSTSPTSKTPMPGDVFLFMGLVEHDIQLPSGIPDDMRKAFWKARAIMNVEFKAFFNNQTMTLAIPPKQINDRLILLERP